MPEIIETILVENPEPTPVEFTSFAVEKRKPETDEMIGAGIPEEFALIAAEVALESLRKIDLQNRQTKVDSFKQHSQDTFDKEQAEHIAETDALTGLRNRKGLMNELQKRTSSESSDSHFALVFVDLDGFKAVNDTHGHEAGDDVLAGVGKFFKEALKKDDPEDEGFKFRNDDEAFRLGGDEFVILIRTDKQGNGRRSASKDEEETLEGFQARLNKGIINSGIAVDKDIEVSGSFGFAQYTHGESVKDFITRADKEMYKKKISKKALAEVDSFYEDIADNQQQRRSTKLGRESVVEINNRTYTVYDISNITANFAYWAKQQAGYKQYFDFDNEYFSDNYKIPGFMNNVFGQFVDKFPAVTKMLLTTNPQNRHDFSDVQEYRILLGNMLFDYCAPELPDKVDPVELTK